MASSTVQFFEAVPLLGDGERMDQRGRDQPGHERGVLDRIPEPPAAPAELVVGPGAAEGDADGEEDPRRRRPRPRPARPGRVEVAADQRRDRERERDREADVAHVEHRRMDHHPRVLEQRVELATFGGGRDQAVERVRRREQEEQEAEREQAHHGEDPGRDFLGQVAAEGGDRERPDRQHQQPEQDRAFVAAPGRGDPVLQRQGAVRIGRDVEDREVVADEAEREADEGERDQRASASRRRVAPGPSSRHRPRAAPTIGMTPRMAATPRAIQRAR